MWLEDEVSKSLSPWMNATCWVVGFSGGMDSTVLLHLLVSLKNKNENIPPLSAIYIHHGLQAVAESWSTHCQKVCEKLGVPLQIIPVTVAKEASIEQAAREARYQAFSHVLGEQEVLFTAQHKNDQAETVLFRLVRGSGVRGLSGMPVARSLGLGHVVRPLLNCPYEELKKYATFHQLTWVDDPSNDEIYFARNYIRHAIIPALQVKWPQAVSSITQAAEHLREAQELLTELAIQDLHHSASPPLFPWLKVPSLLFSPLVSLSWSRQKNALSHWLSAFTLLPSTAHWQAWKSMQEASEEALPQWQLGQVVLCRSGGRLWLLQNQWLKAIDETVRLLVSVDSDIALESNGTVTLTGDLPKGKLMIGYRQGGEFLRLKGRGKRTLKRLFNEASIPFFVRSRLPLLFSEDGELMAVANFPEWRDESCTHEFLFNWSLA